MGIDGTSRTSAAIIAQTPPVIWLIAPPLF
jgi:hypothetical protein